MPKVTAVTLTTTSFCHPTPSAAVWFFLSKYPQYRLSILCHHQLLVGLPHAVTRHGSAPIFPQDSAPITPHDPVPRVHEAYCCLRPQTYDEHDFDLYSILSYCLGFWDFCSIAAFAGRPSLRERLSRQVLPHLYLHRWRHWYCWVVY